jgi:hypothetical protein
VPGLREVHALASCTRVRRGLARTGIRSDEEKNSVHTTHLAGGSFSRSRIPRAFCAPRTYPDAAYVDRGSMKLSGPTRQSWRLHVPQLWCTLHPRAAQVGIMDRRVLPCPIKSVARETYL